MDTQRGLTLIELMVVVTIVAILAALAYPSYREFTARGARTDAKTILLEDAQFLERNYTEAHRYDQNAAGAAVTLPYGQSPRTGTAYYTITLAAAATTFTLTAAPVAGQFMAGDPCGSFTLNQMGQKGVSGATRTAAECWNR